MRAAALTGSPLLNEIIPLQYSNTSKFGSVLHLILQMQGRRHTGEGDNMTDLGGGGW